MEFPVFHLPAVVLFRQVAEDGGPVRGVPVQEVQGNGNGAFPSVPVHQGNVPLVPGTPGKGGAFPDGGRRQDDSLIPYGGNVPDGFPFRGAFGKAASMSAGLDTQWRTGDV